MVSLDFRTIFQRHIGLITDYNLPRLDPKDFEELETEWLCRAMSNPRVRHIFSSFNVDEDDMIITFELKNSVDEYSDKYFVIELFALGMVIAWLEPQVDSILNTAPMIGGKEEKILLNNHKNSIERLKQLEIKRQQLIRDYGYLNGLSADV